MAWLCSAIEIHTVYYKKINATPTANYNNNLCRLKSVVNGHIYWCLPRSLIWWNNYFHKKLINEIDSLNKQMLIQDLFLAWAGDFCDGSSSPHKKSIAKNPSCVPFEMQQDLIQWSNEFFINFGENRDK